MKRTLVLIWALVVVGSVLAAGPARASCAAPPPLPRVYAQTDVVFKGTVEEFGNNTATVRVDDIWKGPPLPETVAVITGVVDDDPDDGLVPASSVDRHLEVGVTYLFFPVNESSPFEDNICTSTRRYRPALERLRDPSRSIDPAEPSGEGPSELPRTGTGATLIVWMVVAWLAMGLGAWFLFFRRDRSRPPG